MISVSSQLQRNQLYFFGALLIGALLFIALALPLERLPSYDDLTNSSAQAWADSKTDGIPLYSPNFWRPVSGFFYSLVASLGPNEWAFGGAAIFMGLFGALGFSSLCWTLIDYKTTRLGSFFLGIAPFLALCHPASQEAWSWVSAFGDCVLWAGAGLCVFCCRIRPPFLRGFLFFMAALFCALSKEFFILAPAIAFFPEWIRQLQETRTLTPFPEDSRRMGWPSMLPWSGTIGACLGTGLVLSLRFIYLGSGWDFSAHTLTALPSVVDLKPLTDWGGEPWRWCGRALLAYLGGLFGGPAVEFWPSLIEGPSSVTILSALLALIVCTTALKVSLRPSTSPQAAALLSLAGSSLILCLYLSLAPLQGQVAGDAYYANRYFLVPAGLAYLSCAALFSVLHPFETVPKPRRRTLCLGAVVSFFLLLTSYNCISARRYSSYWKGGTATLWPAVLTLSPGNPVALSWAIQDLRQHGKSQEALHLCWPWQKRLSFFSWSNPVRGQAFFCEIAAIESSQMEALRALTQAYQPFEEATPELALMRSLTFLPHDCSTGIALIQKSRQTAAALHSAGKLSSERLEFFQEKEAWMQHHCQTPTP